MQGLSPRARSALLTEVKQRLAANRLADYVPYAKQMEFHAAGAVWTTRERLLKAGNQVGKTWSAGFEHAMHLTGRYPDNWPGAVFEDPTIGWAASETSQGTRDTVQRILLGQVGEWGTGAIPKDSIIEIKRAAHGVADAVETILVRYGGGGDVQAGQSRLTIKTYDQGRARWQGETMDFVWFDEEPPEDIYFEGLTRTNARHGLVTLTFTPLKGMSNVVRRFIQEKPAGTVVTNMTIHDAEHYTPEQRAAIIATYPSHEREARINGTPTLGSGRIYQFSDDVVAESQIQLPAHWPRIAAIDFGWDHPTSVVWLAWDRDNDVIHLYDAYRVSETTPQMHAVAIKARGDWIPMMWPHDGAAQGKDGGAALAKQYRDHGVLMHKDRATHAPDKKAGQKEGEGGNSVEVGIQALIERMETGRFRVAKHLTDWFEEFRLYHRDDGKIVKVNDDLMDATRYAVMMLRHSKVRPVDTKQSKVKPFRSTVDGMGLMG